MSYSYFDNVKAVAIDERTPTEFVSPVMEIDAVDESDSDSDFTSEVDHTKFPFITSRSTGTECSDLLSAILATDKLDEISTVGDFVGVQDYIRNEGHADESGKTTTGVAFWLYPTGLYGPYHLNKSGVVEKHGVLLTIEAGVLVDEAVERAKVALIPGIIVHEHVAAS